MENSNHEMLKRVLEDRPPAAPADRELRERLARWYEGRRNFVLAWATLYVLISAALIAAGVHLFATGWDTRIMLGGAVLVAAGFSVNVVVKLWYWIVDSKIALAKELKELRLAARRAERGSDAGDLPQEDLVALLPEEFIAPFLHERRSLWERLSRRTAGRIASAVVVMGGIAAGLAIGVSLGKRPAGIEVKQVDEWRFSREGAVDVRSQLAFTRCPGDGRYVTISLPYSAGELLAATHAERQLPFARVDWHRYEIELPVELPSLEGRPLVVEWRFPMSCLDVEPMGYRTPLAALMPVAAYRLEVDVDPAAGFEVVGQPHARRITPFFGGAREPKQLFGWCTVTVRPVGESRDGDAESSEGPASR